MRIWVASVFPCTRSPGDRGCFFHKSSSGKSETMEEQNCPLLQSREAESWQKCKWMLLSPASSFVSFATVFVVRTIQILTHPSLCVDGGWGSGVTASAPASLMVSDCAVSNFFFLDVTLTSLKPVTGEVGIWSLFHRFPPFFSPWRPDCDLNWNQGRKCLNLLNE